MYLWLHVLWHAHVFSEKNMIFFVFRFCTFIYYSRKWSDEIIWICNLDIMEMQKYVSFLLFSILKKHRIFTTWNAGIMEMKFWVWTWNIYTMLFSVQVSVPAWYALRSLASSSTKVGLADQSLKLPFTLPWFHSFKYSMFGFPSTVQNTNSHRIWNV